MCDEACWVHRRCCTKFVVKSWAGGKVKGGRYTFLSVERNELTETKLPPLIGVAMWLGVYGCEGVNTGILSVVHFSKFGCVL